MVIEVVILPSVILKLAFITEIIYNPSEKRTEIEYLKFNSNNSFGVDVTKKIIIPETEMTFEEIKKLITVLQSKG